MAAQFEDSGLYVCLAENRLGRVMEEAELTVLGTTPSTPRRSNINASRDCILLQFTVSGLDGRHGLIAPQHVAMANKLAHAPALHLRLRTAVTNATATPCKLERAR